MVKVATSYILSLSLVACGRSGPRSSLDPVKPPAPLVTAPQPTTAMACEGLMSLHLEHVTIRDARLAIAKPAGAGAPALPPSCRVMGTSAPTADSDIRFEVAIPVGQAWNGRYLQVGNGGFAGLVPEEDILAGLAAGYATAGTDDGHQSRYGTSASWAMGHPEKIVDFGYRAVKETRDAAREILRAYTGQSAKYAYFTGCSDGGREALMEAQRFPEDFNGIVAGAPANDTTNLLFGMAWTIRALLETPASYIPRAKLTAIEAAALKSCGDADGVVEDPLACKFDPAVLRCTGAENDQCLTDAQIAALRKIYRGAENPRTGARIEPGFEPGAEGQPGGWDDWIVGSAPGEAGHAVQFLFSSSFFRYMVFADPTYDLGRLSFDGDVATTDAKLASILNSSATDLGAFKKRGGKLLQYHGWADPVVPPRDSVGYYERVQAAMGDPRDFYRLFMAPGMLHCDGGPGPNVAPTLATIAAWVEAGAAPDRVVATKLAGDNPAGAVVRTKPLCPYPQMAKWDEKGDRKRAESYRCEAPLPIATPRY